VDLGGLHILGTERHESRRIDNQLRGRAGRQGDPGSARFYLSLQDDLMRIFGGHRMQNLMLRLGMEEDVPIESNLITKRIAAAQKAVEAQNFESRKHLLEYDDVMNRQREVVYHRRRELLSGAPLKDEILDMCDELVEGIILPHAEADKDPADWEWKEIEDGIFKQFKVRPNFRETEKIDELNSAEDLVDSAIARIKSLYDQRETEFTEPVMRQIEKIVMLQTLDSLWKDHLLAMDHLKEGIGLRGYGQKNPLVEYQKEGFEMFEAMMRVTQQDVVEKVFSVQVRREQDVAQIEQQQQRPQKVVMSHGTETVDQSAATVKREADKVGRNDACPCGSGKKYKRCHGK
jgi:preprotein translocase subunit SecA